MMTRNCTCYMNYVCCFQNPKEKDGNSKQFVLNGDLKVTWCSSPALPGKVSPKGKEYWYQWTGSLRDALGEKNSLPECCSSRKEEGEKTCYTWISLPSVRRRPRVTNYLNCDKGWKVVSYKFWVKNGPMHCRTTLTAKILSAVSKEALQKFSDRS